jgi:hypothetical protein
MTIRIKNHSSGLDQKKISLIKKFLQFLQSEVPLKKGITITFVGQRDVNMTTGVRKRGHKIHVLADGRLLIDVFRTLAHEWTHEFQYQKLNLDDTKKHQDIGGPVENMANALAGIMVKKFNKENPSYEKYIYKSAEEHQK